MPGYWERVVASYLEGKMTGPFMQRFFDADNNSAYDVSSFIGGGISTQPLPPYPSAWLIPFINPHKHAFSTIFVVVTTAVPLSNVAFALYRDTLNSGFPYLFELVQPFGTAPTDVLGNAQSVISYELPQGYYYLAVTNNSAGVRVSSVTGPNTPTIMGYTRAAPNTRRIFASTGLNEPFGSWDSVIPVAATNASINVPRILLTLDDIR
jgi:hypothetical protein